MDRAPIHIFLEGDSRICLHDRRNNVARAANNTHSYLIGQAKAVEARRA
jgi:hypothetical protein